MLALVTDLIFATKIASTAGALERRVSMARTLERFGERLAEQPGAVVIDLDADVDVLAAIELCRSCVKPPLVIAFVSHVRADLIEAARRAGADEVMARSAFVTKLPGLIERHAPPAEPAAT